MALPASKATEVFTVHQGSPLNAEPAADALVAGKQSWKTQRSLQYLRNHGEILHLPRAGYKFAIEIEDDLKSALQITDSSLLKNDAVALDDMVEKLGRTDLAAALQVGCPCQAGVL